MPRRRSGFVTIYLDEHISEISDDDLIAEVKARKLTLAPPVTVIDPPVMDLIAEAHTELLCGRTVDAMLILDRLVAPKWKAPAEALKAYEALRSTPPH